MPTARPPLVQRIHHHGHLEAKTAVLMALATVPLAVYGVWALRRTVNARPA